MSQLDVLSEAIGLPHVASLWDHYHALYPDVSQELFCEQVQREYDDHKEAKDKFLDDQRDTSVSERFSSRAVLRKVLPRVVEGLEEYKASGKSHSGIKQVLDLIPTWEIAAITARVMLNAAQEDTPYVRTCHILGEEIQKQASFVNFRTSKPGMFRVCMDAMLMMQYEYRQRTLKSYFDRFKCNVIIPKEILIKTGMICTSAFIQASGLVELKTVPIPDRHTRGFKSPCLTVRFTQGAEELLEDITIRFALLKTNSSPMVVPPIPWATLDLGGFILNGLIRKDTFVRSSHISRSLLERDTDLSKVYEAANILQSTRWKINEYMCELLVNNHQHLTDLVPDLSGLELPPKPWEEGTSPPHEVLKEWKRQAVLAHYKFHKTRTIRHQFMRRLELAKRNLHRPLWFCWSCDFRGRLNVIQNWLTPQSDDVGKSLLTFHDEHMLTRGGKLSLEIHVSNMFGNDKCSYGDRIKWTRDHIALIRESVDRPLGQTWWQQADKPLVFLASCHALMEGLRGRAVGIPVAADGSCNGLQHLSAIGRDLDGAVSTNVSTKNVDVSKGPQDVYSKILSEVRDDMKSQPIYESIQGYIDRKLVKRPVMTTPYSVTRRGMQEQVAEELRKRDLSDDVLKACNVVSESIERSRMALLSRAMEVMDYLKNVAAAMNDKELPIVWTTPTGFKVIQMYRKGKSKMIHLTYAKQRIQVMGYVSDSDMNKYKQRLGIAPNFVHSMDASHLVFTILHAHSRGICDFGMVHDSYATHANQSGLLGTLLREEFYKLHSHDALKDFHDGAQKFLGDKIPPMPDKGGLQIADVLKAPYFFSNAPQEILEQLLTQGV